MSARAIKALGRIDYYVVCMEDWLMLITAFIMEDNASLTASRNIGEWFEIN